jgi:hypothetical protein
MCTQVNMMFVMLLLVCIHTGQDEKFAWPRCEGHRGQAFKQTFHLARCGCTLRVTSQTPQN